MSKPSWRAAVNQERPNAFVFSSADRGEPPRVHVKRERRMVSQPMRTRGSSGVFRTPHVTYYSYYTYYNSRLHHMCTAPHL
jgi:hypothetical protein